MIRLFLFVKRDKMKTFFLSEAFHGSTKTTMLNDMNHFARNFVATIKVGLLFNSFGML